MYVKELEPTFEAEFPGGIKMVLRRLDAWHLAAVQHRATRAAELLRDGSATLVRYGLEPEEFQALADPQSWISMTEIFYTIELGMVAIKSWTGVRRAGETQDLPVLFDAVARLMRIPQIQHAFLIEMVRNGNRFVIGVDEGNA